MHYGYFNYNASDVVIPSTVKMEYRLPTKSILPYNKEKSFSKEDIVAELTDEQIKQEEEFLKGIPRINIGALVLPAIWGPGHGMWATILYYPLLLFADNALYAAWTEQTVLSIVIAVLIVGSLIAGTIVFSIVSQPFAAHRADAKGVSKEEYVRRERIWAVVCIVLAIAALAWATYYNLTIRPTLNF